MDRRPRPRPPRKKARKKGRKGSRRTGRYLLCPSLLAHRIPVAGEVKQGKTGCYFLDCPLCLGLRIFFDAAFDPDVLAFDLAGLSERFPGVLVPGAPVDSPYVRDGFTVGQEPPLEEPAPHASPG